MPSSTHGAATAAPYDHDLIIVGGGPAGISTALFLLAARPELRTRIVVLEKEHYPREKFCAGALSGRGDAVLASIGVRVDVPSIPIHGLTLKLPLGTVGARSENVARVVRRIQFDHELARIAMARGIRVVEGVSVNQVTVDADGVSLQTSAGSLRARAVVGADGVGSVVRKSFDAAPGPWRAQVMEVDTPFTGSEATDVLHFDCEDQTYAGYEWDFPTIVEGKAMVCRGA
jgi:flavin-dependent dehydrogenase